MEDDYLITLMVVDLLLGMNEVMPNSHLPSLLIYNIYIVQHSGINKYFSNICYSPTRHEEEMNSMYLGVLGHK